MVQLGRASSRLTWLEHVFGRQINAIGSWGVEQLAHLASQLVCLKCLRGNRYLLHHSPVYQTHSSKFMDTHFKVEGLIICNHFYGDVLLTSICTVVQLTEARGGIANPSDSKAPVA